LRKPETPPQRSTPKRQQTSPNSTNSNSSRRGKPSSGSGARPAVQQGAGQWYAGAAARPRNKQTFKQEAYQNLERKLDAKVESEERRRKARELHAQQQAAEFPDSAKPETIRLNRAISQAGVCGRREADEMIKNGLVQVNGAVVKEMGTKVKPDRDIIKVNGKRIQSQQLVYLLLNKPKNHVTTLNDPEGRHTVMDTIKGATEERVFPVGRLDRNTTGLLIITNDGDMTKKLTHPSFQVKKVYHVKLDRPVSLEDLDALRKGIMLDDGPARADKADYVDAGGADEVGIEIHSGRNRIVRRMFEHLGFTVKSLDRVGFAHLSKKGLPRGNWRFLTDQEVAFLKMLGNPKTPVRAGAKPERTAQRKPLPRPAGRPGR